VATLRLDAATPVVDPLREPSADGEGADADRQPSDQKAHEALKSAEEKMKLKNEKIQQIKHLRSQLSAVQSEIAKCQEQKDECIKFKQSLEKLTPQELRAVHRMDADAGEKAGATLPPDATMADLLPNLPRNSKEVLAYRGIRNPSPIQAIAVPRLIEGLSAVVHSETGSGKTLSFLLPALERVRKVDAAGGGPAVVLAIAPTRELAVQIMAEAENLCHGELALVALAAQASWDTLLGATLIIATPQELLETFDRQDAEEVKLLLDRVEVCILDEFDELLPKRKYEGRRYSRYQDGGMWPTEGFLKRLVRNSERPSLQVIAASATAYQASRTKLFKVLRRDQQGRFQHPLPVLEPPLADMEGLDAPPSAADGPDWDPEAPLAESGEADDDGEEAEQEALDPAAGREEGSAEGRHRTAPRYPTLPTGIKHFYWRTPPGGSHALALAAALDKLRPQSALVFVCPNARESVRTVVEDLQLSGWTGAMALAKHLFPDSRHSSERKTRKSQGPSGEAKAWRSANKLHELRETTRRGFAAAHWDAPVLVSAEESVRGLHLDAVEAVFILGMPKTAASYMHMAGRTGRLPHPFGRAVLVAHGLQIAKVTRGFSGQTTIRQWRELGRGSPSVATSLARKKRKQKKQVKREAARMAAGEGPPKRRSSAAIALDAALGPPVRRG